LEREGLGDSKISGFLGRRRLVKKVQRGKHGNIVRSKCVLTAIINPHGDEISMGGKRGWVSSAEKNMSEVGGKRH